MWFQIPKDSVLENLRVRSWLKSFSPRGASAEREITQLYWQIESESNLCGTMVLNHSAFSYSLRFLHDPFSKLYFDLPFLKACKRSTNKWCKYSYRCTQYYSHGYDQQTRAVDLQTNGKISEERDEYAWCSFFCFVIYGAEIVLS